VRNVQAAFSAVVGAMLSFFIFISPGSAQQTGCENGVVQLPAGINGTLTICSATASDLEAIRIQLARLSAIASHSSDQQFEVAKFINEIHAAAQLLNDKGRETLLAQSVADLLKKEQGRSDEGMLREIENISSQIADLRERIDEKGRQANSASQTGNSGFVVGSRRRSGLVWQNIFHAGSRVVRGDIGHPEPLAG
jgi:hypothetical protein